MTPLILAGAFDFLKPVGALIGLLKIPFIFVLQNLYNWMHGVGPLNYIGAYGLSILLLTVLIKLCLFPLYQKQLTMSRKTQEEQRRIAPDLAVLRKKYKGDPQKLNTEMMALYKEHGINPLGGLAGCLPTLAQLPILIGLYQAIYNFHSNIDAHFLWVSSLTRHASLTEPITWILPALAGLSTFVQSKMFTPPRDPNADQDSQAAQMAQMSQTMSLIMPLVIVYFSFQPQVFQGLILYWVVSNIFSIVQQYFVNGWGQMPFLGNRTVLQPAPAGNGAARPRPGREPRIETTGQADIAPAAVNGNGAAAGGGQRRRTGGGKRRRR